MGLTAQEFACHYPDLRGGAAAAYRALMREGVAHPALLPHGLPTPADIRRTQSTEGEVAKFLLDVAGARGVERLQTESVVIPMVGRKQVLSWSLCVSSQVGCAMGCTFCETAQMGLIRALEPWEIVAQWWTAAHVLGRRPRNIVFMGMGEPMDNLDHVLQAIAVLTDHAGPAVPMSKIVISTVGRLDGIRRLAQRVRTPGWHRLNLAVSVNAPNDEIRSRLMPINRAAPMAELRRALEAWPTYGGAKICIEYVLIPGVNDQQHHAQQLAAWVRGLPGSPGHWSGAVPLPACVNIIPYNPRRDSPWPAPTERRVEEFLGWLLDHDVYCKRRRTKGRDTMAACGQLGNPHIRGRKLVAITSSATRHAPTSAGDDDA